MKGAYLDFTFDGHIYKVFFRNERWLPVGVMTFENYMDAWCVYGHWFDWIGKD